ncbi:1-acyl-sn-glycerol-3-phosphate acyltransferase [Scytonema millei]|uniref:Glycerol acyltransferase n=1 Tax=Scytonema millei VB511283 TaxID=1245923 RepID=A0A9X5E8Z2_9CYAN|nr:1-acyl-sn-glycerol-3-phosphate acyltransferase [Scytonema millei]NHC36237.1 glycerol acyltransferase [Scytonema millei VB511283]
MVFGSNKNVSGYKFTWFDRFCLWYPPGWLILFNRHWQHYHADPDGWNWLEYGLFLLPGGFYIALLLRWLRLGCRFPRQPAVQFDRNYQQAFRNEVLAPIAKYYYRGELRQIENLPESESMIVAMNHAGMSFPWDFIVLAYLLSTVREWNVKPLAGVSLFDHPWMIWWLPPGWSQVLGGVRAEKEEFETAIAQKTVLLYAPEGLRGPSKGWQQRYQLASFDPSFIRLSDRHQIPILPVICLGNEFLHPFAINLNLQHIGKILGLPFLPLSPLMPLFALFPSMGVWAMRSRLRYFVQPVYRVDLKDRTSRRERVAAYQAAQAFRDKLQNAINCILSGSGDK